MLKWDEFKLPPINLWNAPKRETVSIDSPPPTPNPDTEIVEFVDQPLKENP